MAAANPGAGSGLVRHCAPLTVEGAGRIMERRLRGARRPWERRGLGDVGSGWAELPTPVESAALASVLGIGDLVCFGGIPQCARRHGSRDERCLALVGARARRPRHVAHRPSWPRDSQDASADQCVQYVRRFVAVPITGFAAGSEGAVLPMRRDPDGPGSGGAVSRGASSDPDWMAPPQPDTRELQGRGRRGR